MKSSWRIADKTGDVVYRFDFAAHISSLVFKSFPVALAGGPKSRLLRRHEAGSGGPDGATSGVCSHHNQDCPQTPAHSFRWLGGWVWPVGGLWVSRSLPCRLVSGHRLPAPATCRTEWVNVTQQPSYSRNRNIGVCCCESILMSLHSPSLTCARFLSFFLLSLQLTVLCNLIKPEGKIKISLISIARRAMNNVTEQLFRNIELAVVHLKSLNWSVCC